MTRLYIEYCEANKKYYLYRYVTRCGKKVKQRLYVSYSKEKVIVYKVDRISRSLLDFVGIYSEFEKRRVEFVSCCEQFDTSNAMGKATLQIIMVLYLLNLLNYILDNYLIINL